MGGDRAYPYPKRVWSFSGGWWPNPSRGRVNSGFALFSLLAASIGFMSYNSTKVNTINYSNHTINYSTKDPRKHQQTQQQQQLYKYVKVPGKPLTIQE